MQLKIQWDSIDGWYSFWLKQRQLYGGKKTFLTNMSPVTMGNSLTALNEVEKRENNEEKFYEPWVVKMPAITVDCSHSFVSLMAMMWISYKFHRTSECKKMFSLLTKNHTTDS